MAARKTSPKPADTADENAEELCPEHYPHGWDTVPEDFAGVGCEHGSWTRPEDETEPES